MSCVILGCKSHSSRLENEAESISFHRFPTDDTKRKKWINAVARTNWQYKIHHRICSKHFTNDSFINIEHKWRRLNTKAVPSLRLCSVKNIVPKKSTSFDAVPTSNSISMPTAQQQIDLAYCVFQLEQNLERLKKVARQRLLKVNALRKMTKRLKKKNMELHMRLVNVLKKNES